VTTNLTLTTNNTVIIANSTAAKLTLRLPSATVNAGRYYVVKLQTGANSVVIQPPAGQTINGNPSLTLSVVGSGSSLISDGANWITLP
jgi:hypothetical protein